ncbi:hypothetical protein EV699_11488 [Plasticicumulans lactativorans]|uniref:Predicted 3'-5' exonuclease PolB-like domain-containing protein n=1 Tax=Plasticicumulans lactativorans TaxID=1133106 RepID=A0A4R2L1W2_9GAMM|nr:hypothetical protein EV699_11488 [Plasticicumulans lactativorans]
MNALVFDIETVPDVAGARRLHGFAGLDDAAVAEAMFLERRQTTGNEFVRHHLQRVVAIAVVMRRGNALKCAALGSPTSSEAELIAEFFDVIDKTTPTLVSWNGSGFDLPVLHYRALLHGVRAPRYWDTGESDAGMRYNHYLGRFHWRHTDLMDVLAGYQARAAAPLDEIATLLGLPGKLGMDGGQVWGAFRQGQLDAIRDYCETDVLNTYLIWLRFERMRGRLDDAGHAAECERLRAMLQADARAPCAAFLAAWSSAAAAAAAPASPSVPPPRAAASPSAADAAAAGASAPGRSRRGHRAAPEDRAAMGRSASVGTQASLLPFDDA